MKLAKVSLSHKPGQNKYLVICLSKLTLVQQEKEWTAARIAEAVNQGSREAESALVEKYWASLHQVLRGRNAPNPEDLCQEAFIVVIERLRSHPLDDPSQLANYLRRTAINLSIRDIRRSIRQQTDPASDLLDALPGLSQVEDVMNNEELRRAVRDLIKQLPQARDRKVLWLHYVEDWDKAAICEQLDIESKSFNNIVSRARARVRDLLLKSHVEIEV